MRVSVLGPVEIEATSGPVAFPGGKVGLLLGRLLVAPNCTHSHRSLFEYLWPDEQYSDHRQQRARLQIVVSRLRTFLSDGGEGLELRTDRDGYRLEADAASLDSLLFQDLARQVLIGDDSRLGAVLRMWRGEPFGGLPVSPDLAAARMRLSDMHRVLDGMQKQAAPQSATREAFARTKFLPPALDSPDLIERPRLLERLGRVGESRVVAVSAPAGFGKSVLLSQWAAAQLAPVAWVSLYADDSDFRRFWWAMAEAMTHSGILDGRSLTDAAAGSQRFLEALEDRLSRRDGPVGLVLDDYHRVASARNLGLGRLLDALPPSVTLAVGTREPVSDRAGVDQVPTVTAANLRFADEETVAVLKQGGEEPPQDAADAVARVTEGWPIAVAYLNRSRTAEVGIGSVPADLHDFVVEEMLDTLPAGVRRFVLESSLLETVNASLCDAATGRSDAAESIDWLRRRGMLLVGAEPDTGWYRYHSLVTGALAAKARMDPGIDSSALLQRAARWCRENGLDDQALEYAIGAGDSDLVASLAGPVAASRAERGEIHSVQQLLERLDPEVVARDRATHDTLMFLVAAWLDPASAQRWVDSRAGYGDHDDVPAMLVDAHRLLVRGRFTEVVDLHARIRSATPSYFGRHPTTAGLDAVVDLTVEVASLCCRVMRGEVSLNDEELPTLWNRAQRYGPAASVWVLGEWAFLAYVEGDCRRAESLLRRLDEDTSALDPPSIELGATRALATRALLDSDRSMNPAHQRSVVARLEPLARLYESLGWYTDLIPVLLALHVASYRATDFEAAAAYATRVDLLLDDCPQAVLFVRARNLLYQSMAERDGRLPVGGLHALTERQRAVLDLLGAGSTYRQIAEKLDVTLGSVRASVRSLYQKLGVHNRYDAVAVLEARRPHDRPD